MIGPLLKQEIENTFRVVPGKSTAEELVFMCPEAATVQATGLSTLKPEKPSAWRCNKGKNNKGHFLAWARALGYTFAADDGSTSTPVDQLLYEQDKQSSAVPVIQEVELPKGFTPIVRHPESI